MRAEDYSHLNRLTWLHAIAAVFTVLFGLLFFGHVYIGWQVMNGSINDLHFSSTEEAEDFGLLFVLGGALAIATVWSFAGLLVLAAVALNRRKYRTLCLIISGVNCAFFPLGTALGVYGILTLTRPGVVEAFSEASELARCNGPEHERLPRDRSL